MTKTMTAEEVEYDSGYVAEVLGGLGAECMPHIAALSRLAAQAARVPGLEQRAKDDAALLESRKSDLAEALSERDAARQDAADYRYGCEELTRERATLRERVATLSAEAETWKKAAHAVNDLHDTAEARVKELEAKVERQWEERQALEHAAETRVRELEWSQPPPAPVQGDAATALRSLALGLGDMETSQRMDATPRELDAAIVAYVQRLVTSPTPPPGLREAVRKAFAPLLDPRQLGDMLSSDPVALTALRGISGDQMDVLLAWLEQRILAAYDATGGEGSAPVSVQGDFDAVKAAMGAHPRHGKAALMRLARDAAKYRAAVERWESGDFVGWQPGRAVHFVLTGQDRGPEPLDTPPSGPGGGERNPEANAEAWAKGVRAKEALVREMLQQHRARIAPTPTTEGKTIQGVIEQGGTPPVGDASHPPQPPAPDVVWQGDGLKVKADGSVWDTHEHRAPWQVAEILARALAEAKREVAALRAEIVEHLKAGMTAREAAESMRERAATAAKTARHRVLVTDESFGVYAMACEDIELSIRRLTLE